MTSDEGGSGEQGGPQYGGGVGLEEWAVGGYRGLGRPPRSWGFFFTEVGSHGI